MGIYKAEAIVLRSRVYGEADRLITLFSREHGQISAIARGVRKPASRLRGAVQLFSHTSLVLYSGQSLDTVSQGEALEDFSYIQERVELLAAASYFAELVLRLTMERQPLPDVFRLLLDCLRLLENGEPELLARIFEVRMLVLLGYRPVLEGCVLGDHQHQGSEAEGGEASMFWFSAEHGGVLCPACAAVTPGARRVSAATINAMAYFLRTPLKMAMRVRLSGRCRQEMASLLHDFLTYHSGIRPHAWSFWNELRADHE